jgi:ABC-type cobalamin/Fe3+-siderophores transport system ATPase subunit
MQGLASGNTFRIQWLDNPRTLKWACVSAWLLPLLVIAVLTALDPVKHSVTPVYHVASENWWAGKNLDQVTLLVQGEIRARGLPEEVLNAQQLSSAYHTRLRVYPNGPDGRPFVLPA